MIRTRLVTVLVLGALAPWSPSAPPDLQGKTLKQTFDRLLPGMANPTGKDNAQQKWQDLCFQLGAPGNEALRLEACKLMADKLGAASPRPTRIWLLKQLERLGREECVAAVATLLEEKDDQVRDAAVRCLANNPSERATASLLAPLPAAKGKARIGLLNALGQRDDRAALDAVIRELTSMEVDVAIAAARVLGRLATPEAAQAIRNARGEKRPAVRLALGDAYLRCADRLLREGKQAEALTIYKEMHRAEEPAPIRLAALTGVLKASGDQAGPMILNLLAGDDAGARAVAIAQIEHLGAGALKPLAANLEKLPVPSRVLVLHAIAARGDKSELPVVLAAAKDANESIRRAGLQALARFGDPEVVPVLLDAVQAGGSLADIAADSLSQAPGDAINAKLLALLDAERIPGRTRVLLGMLERRKVTTAVTRMLKYAGHEDQAVRSAAFAGLRALAEPRHIPGMVLAMRNMPKGSEREQAEQAIVAVCGQIAEPEKRAALVLAQLKDAPGQLAELLPLLGRLGGVEVLRLARQALSASTPELVEAGITALCNWPDPSASADLLALAKSVQEEKSRQRVLLALIRVNAVLSELPPVPRLTVLKQTMELATRHQERRALLDAVGFVRHLDTLRYVVPYLDDKELQQSACRAVVELAHSRTLREPNQAEFNKVLDRVITICKDKGLIERAKQYRQRQ